MKNWAGQNIEVGDIVWRGSRDGNTSNFKIGRATKLNEAKRTVTVQWLFEQGYSTVDASDLSTRARVLKNSGTSTVDSLTPIVVDLELLEREAEELEIRNQNYYAVLRKHRGMPA